MEDDPDGGKLDGESFHLNMSEAPYQAAILAHSRAPHGFGALDPCDARAAEVNRLCGDEVEVFLRRRADGTLSAGFTAKACALCRASSSILMSLCEGQAASAAETLTAGFAVLFGDLDVPETAALPGTEALFTIKAYPSRSRCVLLPWTAMAAALRQLRV